MITSYKECKASFLNIAFIHLEKTEMRSWIIKAIKYLFANFVTFICPIIAFSVLRSLLFASSIRAPPLQVPLFIKKTKLFFHIIILWWTVISLALGWFIYQVGYSIVSAVTIAIRFIELFLRWNYFDAYLVP